MLEGNVYLFFLRQYARVIFEHLDFLLNFLGKHEIPFKKTEN